MNENSTYDDATCDDEARPMEECDIVMRGGITSGVVYPAAIKKISERYNFRSVGGTSAGAIAATVTAAAEYGRRSGVKCRGSVDGTEIDPFDRVGSIPDELKQRSHGEARLQTLFQPTPSLKPLSDLMKAVLGRTTNYTPEYEDIGAWRDLTVSAKIKRVSHKIEDALPWLAIGGGALIAVVYTLLLWPLVRLARDSQGANPLGFGGKSFFQTVDSAVEKVITTPDLVPEISNVILAACTMLGLFFFLSLLLRFAFPKASNEESGNRLFQVVRVVLSRLPVVAFLGAMPGIFIATILFRSIVQKQIGELKKLVELRAMSSPPLEEATAPAAATGSPQVGFPTFLEESPITGLIEYFGAGVLAWSAAFIITIAIFSLALVILLALRSWRLAVVMPLLFVGIATIDASYLFALLTSDPQQTLVDSLKFGSISWSILLLIGTAILAALVGAFTIATYWLFRRASKLLPGNQYGICSGLTMPGHEQSAVTDWLHALTQEVAGRTTEDRPLTVGDLWYLDDYNPEVAELPERKVKSEYALGQSPTETRVKERQIDLALMLTNITRGISHRFPHMEGWRGALYFKPEELETILPLRVVDWLIQKSALSTQEDDVLDKEGFYMLPPPQHLPVILGARISMAFPFLLSAVPLYTPMHEPEDARDAPRRLKQCWFTDGGITSNFPLHFFDSPLPSRPTFAVNLMPASTQQNEEPDDEKLVDLDAEELRAQQNTRAESERTHQPGHPEWDFVDMVRRNNPHTAKFVRFNDFGKRPGVSRFFFALFDTARNWSDTELSLMPGYRDRVVHVKLREHEGGLNLDMPPEVIERLSKRGEFAGLMITTRFTKQPTWDHRYKEKIQLDWDNHRWVRFRSVMAALEQVARQIVQRWQIEKTMVEGPNGALPVHKLIEDFGAGKHDYAWMNDTQKQFATEVMDELVSFVERWNHYEGRTFLGDGGGGVENDCPRPMPRFRLVPPDDADPTAELVHLLERAQMRSERSLQEDAVDRSTTSSVQTNGLDAAGVT